METLIKETTGRSPKVDAIDVGADKGAFLEALLSEPVTITIGPDKEKK